MDIQVMTYNIRHGKGMDKRIDLYRIAEVIEKSNADIIGLNEVDKHFSKRSQFQDQVSWLAKQLNMDYTFAPARSLKSQDSTTVRQYGNALLSRFPILTKKVYPFDFKSGLVEGRSLLKAAIQINENLVQIIVTHLSLNPFLHRMQTDFIVNQFHNYPHPVIIMGDYNMNPRSRGWKKITEEFQDVWHYAGNGKGYTYPSLRPRSRLDYIFVSPTLEIVEAEVLTHLPQASDHLPLKALLRF